MRIKYMDLIPFCKGIMISRPVATSAADITGAGVITVFYDWFNGILQTVSPIV